MMSTDGWRLEEMITHAVSIGLNPRFRLEAAAKCTLSYVHCSYLSTSGGACSGEKCIGTNHHLYERIN